MQQLKTTRVRKIWKVVYTFTLNFLLHNTQLNNMRNTNDVWTNLTYYSIENLQVDRLNIESNGGF